MIASSLAAGDRIRARMVVSKVTSMALALGMALAAVLFVLRHAIAKIFTQDPLVLLFISGERGGNDNLVSVMRVSYRWDV